VKTCAYCPRFAKTTIYLRRSIVRVLLRKPAKRRDVCTDHIERARRPNRGRHE
jgi:hypothetical protein